MTVDLSAKTRQLLKARMKAGGYSSADAAMRAALLSLRQQERAGEFEPGELQGMLKVADAEIERGEVLDGEKALKARRARRAVTKKKAG